MGGCWAPETHLQPKCFGVPFVLHIVSSQQGLAENPGSLGFTYQLLFPTIFPFKSLSLPNSESTSSLVRLHIPCPVALCFHEICPGCAGGTTELALWVSVALCFAVVFVCASSCSRKHPFKSNRAQVSRLGWARPPGSHTWQTRAGNPLPWGHL